MKKTIKKILFIAGGLVLLVIILVVIANFLPKENNAENEGSLGDYKCLSKFKIEKSREYQGDPEEILKLDFFKSFGSGAFFGKIKDYKPEQNKFLAAFINQLMQEQKIKTYLHISADICLYNQDLLNPRGGADLNYYIEHYYCANICQTGNYTLRVNLDADGNFVGYRQDTN